MSSPLLSLAPNVFIEICKFLDDISLLRVPEVSKAAKDSVDLSLPNIRSTNITGFIVSRNVKYKTKLSFGIFNDEDYALWKMCFSCVLTKLPNIECKFGKPHGYISMKLSDCEIGGFLEYIRPLMKKTSIYNFSMRNIQSKKIRVYSNFLEGKIIRDVTVEPSETGDLAPFADLIRKVRPTTIRITAKTLKNDTIKSLPQIARVVRELSIYEDNSRPTIPGMISLIKSLLHGECKELTIYKQVTSADVENLVQYFHLSDKKVSFKARTNVDDMNTQIGAYRVSTIEPLFESRKIWIEHCDFAR